MSYQFVCVVVEVVGALESFSNRLRLRHSVYSSTYLFDNNSRGFFQNKLFTLAFLAKSEVGAP